MKISATRRDDIIREREKYDKITSLLEEKKKAQDAEYEEAIAETRKAVEFIVSEAIGPTFLDIEISADPFGSYLEKKDGSWKDPNDRYAWKISVDVNRNRRWKNEDYALGWDWKVTLDKEGNVTKESGSWSGLNAVTEEQIADLEESVRVMKVLNSIEWNDILRTERARRSDFVDSDIMDEYYKRRGDRPNYEAQLQNAELEELVEDGTKAIQLSADQYWNGTVWIIPTGLTDKFIKGYIFPEYYRGKGEKTLDEIKEMADVRRTSRNKVVVKDGEIVTIDIPQ